MACNPKTIITNKGRCRTLLVGCVARAFDANLNLPIGENCDVLQYDGSSLVAAPLTGDKIGYDGADVGPLTSSANVDEALDAISQILSTLGNSTLVPTPCGYLHTNGAGVQAPLDLSAPNLCFDSTALDPASPLFGTTNVAEALMALMTATGALGNSSIVATPCGYLHTSGNGAETPLDLSAPNLCFDGAALPANSILSTSTTVNAALLALQAQFANLGASSIELTTCGFTHSAGDGSDPVAVDLSAIASCYDSSAADPTSPLFGATNVQDAITALANNLDIVASGVGTVSSFAASFTDGVLLGAHNNGSGGPDVNFYVPATVLEVDADGVLQYTNNAGDTNPVVDLSGLGGSIVDDGDGLWTLNIGSDSLQICNDQPVYVRPKAGETCVFEIVQGCGATPTVVSEFETTKEYRIELGKGGELSVDTALADQHAHVAPPASVGTNLMIVGGTYNVGPGADLNVDLEMGGTVYGLSGITGSGDAATITGMPAFPLPIANLSAVREAITGVNGAGREFVLELWVKHC